MIVGSFGGTLLDPETGEPLETLSSFSLTVIQISEDEFNDAQGLNVLEDTVKNGNFYSIEFNEISGDCSLRYDFYNLKDPYPNDHHYEPAVYIDDNNAELCPFVGEYSVKYNNFYYQFMRKQQ